MNRYALLLILLSALLHVSWNLLSKRNRPTPAFFLIANGASFMVALFLGPGLFTLPVSEIKPLLPWFVLSGLAQGVYFFSLSMAYGTGYLSLIYPLARALPVLLIPLWSLATGEGLPLPISLIGMGLIFLGCLMIPHVESRKDISRFLASPSSLWVLFAGLGTTVYTVTDSHILHELTPRFDSPWEKSLFYLTWELGLTVLFLLLPSLGFRKKDPRHQLSLPLSGAGAAAGIIMSSSYLLILRAMEEAERVSYIGAFRQVSIPLGALAGILFLKEKTGPIKGAGILLITLGLVLTALS